jgi:uncharacterized protein YutD
LISFVKSRLEVMLQQERCNYGCTYLKLIKN